MTRPWEVRGQRVAGTLGSISQLVPANGPPVGVHASDDDLYRGSFTEDRRRHSRGDGGLGGPNTAAEPFTGSSDERLDQEGEEELERLEGPHAARTGAFGHRHLRTPQRVDVALLPGLCHGGDPGLRIRIRRDPDTGIGAGGLREALSDLSDLTAQLVLHAVGVNDTDEAAHDVDVVGDVFTLSVMRRCIDGPAQTGLHRQTDRCCSRYRLRPGPPRDGAVGRIGCGLRGEHDLAPTDAPQLGGQRLRGVGNDNAQALPARVLRHPKELIELLRAGGQGVLSGVPHRNDDEQPDRFQVMAVDDPGEGAHCHLPVIDPHGDGVVAVRCLVRLAVALDPGEGSEQPSGGQVDKRGQNRPLARRSNEDRYRPGLGRP